MISVIIPTYKTPQALDICLKSAVEGQKNKNQIIVVVDGFYNINKEVLDNYKDNIEVLNLEENVGTVRATNLGVYNAVHDKIFIVNDDNVFPMEWDIRLEKAYQPNSVLTPNQIEPNPSMFKQFIHENLGPVDTFDIDLFWEREKLYSGNLTDDNGSTFPFLINKYDYLKIGGIPEDYPSPSGFVADWDFFLKCKLSGMKMLRTYNCHFYHFVSLSAKTPEQINQARQYEADCHEYAKYKWGTYIKHNPKNNDKYL
jgi:glycosyltransferase involved in cell wall biosynthesis